MMSWSTEQSRLATASEIMQMVGAAGSPTHLEVVRASGAGLTAGGYRSSAKILSAVAVHAERPDAGVRRALLARSCSRGLGAPHRVQGLPIHVLALLPQHDLHVHPERPRAPVRAMLPGSLTQKNELSNAHVAMVVFRQEASLTAFDSGLEFARWP